MMSKYFSLAFLFLQVFSWISLAAQVPTEEQLLVFVDAEQEILTAEDQQRLAQTAQDLGLPLRMINVREGAPKEIVYTPSIVFQNEEGRSFFYGRYKNMARLKNFVRTARLVQQQQTDNVKKAIFVMRQGRATITAPYKLTALQGTLPEGFDAKAFKKESQQAMAKGMEAFQLKAQFNHKRTTRSFYFDIHPYRSADGKLYLTMEIYSQYNCIRPIVSNVKQPWLQGTWAQRERLFEEAGKQVEQAILGQLQDLERGDAMVGVPKELAAKTWEELGLALPQKRVTATSSTSSTTEALPQHWTVEKPQDPTTPILIFSFLPPLDNYIGEAKVLNGKLSLSGTQSMVGAKGLFEVAIKDVTMGDAGLDDAVQNKMLKMASFPKASLRFEEVRGEAIPLSFNQTIPVKIKAQFEMLGKQTPVVIEAKLTAIHNDAQEMRLEARASFRLPLAQAFQVDGPDGPAEASNNLQFYLKFYLKPINDEKTN